MEGSSPRAASASLVEIRPGRRIFVEVRDPPAAGGDAPPSATVLFVHGSCGHSGQWDAQAAWLSREQERGDGRGGRDVRVVRYDLLGCGRSEKPREGAPEVYAAGEHYRDLAAVYDRFCASSSDDDTGARAVWIVAHSFGCSLALRLAASERASNVNKLVLVAPASLRFHEGLPLIVTHAPLAALGWLQSRLTDGFVAMAFSPETAARDPALVEAERRASNANPPYMFRAFYRSMAGYHRTEAGEGARAEWFRALPHRIERALIVCGADDRVVAPDAAPEIQAKLGGLPSCALETVERAGHQVCQEQPDRVNKLLGAYFFGGGGGNSCQEAPAAK